MNQQNANNALTDNIVEDIKERQLSLDKIPGLPILSHHSMFWRPTYNNDNSAWVEHIPFAFWMIEAHQPRTFVELGTHQGASYFAFCQAVERLGLDTHCYAVDTWKGDEHSGFYNGKIFEKVRAHNEAQYSSFSRLVRSTFDEALNHFEDGTIDLLHIDGLHTFEAVKHDFDTWLPKLSERAVVVMHDTNVRERNFGVFKLFNQLKAHYPAFEFAHGHGLGVLGVGKKQNASLQSLLQSNTKPYERSAIHQTFGRLGRACGDARATAQDKSRINELSNQVNTQKKHLEELKQSLESTKADLTSRTRNLKEAKTSLKAQTEQQALERGHLEERITMLQDLRIESRREITRLNSRGDETSVNLAKLSRQPSKYKQKIRKAKKSIKSRTQKISRLKSKLDTTKNKAQMLMEQIENNKRNIAGLENTTQKQANALKEHEVKIQAKDKEAVEKQKQIDQLKNEQISSNKHISDLKTKNKKLANEQQALTKKLEDRFKELAILTKMLEDRDPNSQNKRKSETSPKPVLQHLHPKDNSQPDVVKNSWKKYFKKTTNKSTRIKKQSKILQNSDLFDRTWYLNKNPDVANKGIDPIKHYLWHGVTDGRNPGPDFDTLEYLKSYPDVAKSGVNPLIHYIKFGKKEGRISNRVKKG
jgi:hypothetical protein